MGLPEKHAKINRLKGKKSFMRAIQETPDLARSGRVEELLREVEAQDRRMRRYNSVGRLVTGTNGNSDIS